MAGSHDVRSIIAGIASDSESSRKLSVYHLQSLVSEPSFARAFVQFQGVPALKQVVLEENGNALAYALGSLTRLLEMDLGWDHLSSDVIERAVQVVVSRPVINVLRNALLLLVLVVSRPFDPYKLQQPSEDEFGFKALVPLLQVHSNFLDCLVDKLGSADHALCANALHLVNALMRDSVANGGETEWPKFISRLQELGVISGVENLMRGDTLQEIAGPILEFQSLMKILFARWRHILVDLEKAEHRQALKELQISSFPPKYQASQQDLDSDKWQRLGFSSDNPTSDLEDARFLGMMNLTEYVRRNRDTFQRELLEQSVMPLTQRCPIAKASMSITMVLYEHFEIAKMDGQDPTKNTTSPDDAKDAERLAKPLLLRWEDVHAASLNAFIRLWKEAGATTNDYRKIDDLSRLLIRTILGQSDRRASMDQVEEQLGSTTLAKVREWQLQDVSQIYEYAWGQDLRKLREQTHTDALLFMREQRIKCLLQGSWFPNISSQTSSSNLSITPEETQKLRITAWRFVRLSNDRKYLHHASHNTKLSKPPQLHELNERIDVETISSVDSSVARSDVLLGDDTTESLSDKHAPATGTVTRLTIFGTSNTFAKPQANGESVLLELNTSSTSLASEWLDGLLMLLNQQPITADTNKLVDLLEQWSLTIRMLNLRWEDVDWERAQDDKQLPVPSRSGLDDDFWYDM
ncbi:hypothetical protein AUEXF2481DRAFT_4461 [Aureobasidium subglaciale EXF-2481]|uniref:ELMO domain-containing protein n=1 Tax=Aureobasidium subglaciale (strain EXF-2481) TaxID=1043005 RepID=A0A074YEJ5_AURSE|nr:uncharacterized protein AUEXF2481DRAFT_4461 [Aureobasidium subglaciale EXF-2481]KAI5221564.1 hypothetical protein E4T40_05391 [Aureobasidium subglaciale]KAI5261432.1 hypothetical protein E4T46_05102 [Aureobasidium subglaciale]KEQ96218.1 hypothetical protein AUEXF2481DRAFT_4461 [Aureobasidium subglaciale EXF-2481]